MGIKNKAMKVAPSVYARIKRVYWNHLIARHRAMTESQAVQEIDRLYFQRMGHSVDLNNPQRYTEKIQWAKLHAMTPLKSKLADKYAVRSWVSEKIGAQYLIPLLGVWDTADDIDFNALPNSFVLKTNHASGTNIIVPDKSKFNEIHSIAQLNRWLKFEVGWVFFEGQYLRIKPKVIAEQFMHNPDGSEINDYKFICFDGKVKFIRVDLGRHGDHRRVTFDTQWNVLPWVEGDYQRPGILPKRPDRLGELISLVEILAEGFPCVRVDFYIIDGRFYFGEMTFTSAAGYERIIPDEYDFVLGDMWDLSKEDRAELYGRD